MKTILIATDFSAASHNASLYGIELAKALKAKIILFHAYTLTAAAAAINVTVSSYGAFKEMEDKVAQESNLLLPGHEIEMEIGCQEGHAKEMIIAVAKEKQASLIITGMQGQGKNIKKIFGSNATALAATTQLPLLIVPENATFTPVKIIAIASDATGKMDNNLSAGLSEIVTGLGAELYIVHVGSSKENGPVAAQEPTPKKADRTLEATATFKNIAGDNISEALTNFINENEINILAMVPHKHSWANRLFARSETKEMIFVSDIPLLILPDIMAAL